MRVIAMIPARSGSKGLKDKNILPLCGKPLIAHTIEAAVGSGIFDTVHVSTDSQRYAEIAEGYGADVPFLRSVGNSGDTASSWDAVREALYKYGELGERFDICVLLQPTSPLRTAEDIRMAFERYTDSGARTLTSVTEVEHPVQWCFGLDGTHMMDEFSRSPYRNCRRQELEKKYRENGAIFMVRTADIADRDFEFYSECYAYIMDRKSSIDIDTQDDLVLAQHLMSSEF